MNLGAMRTRVSQRLNEGQSGPQFYIASEIDAALNEGLRFFVLLSLGLETTAAWTPNPGPFHHIGDYFPDFVVPLRITSPTGAKVRPSYLSDIAALDSIWPTSPGSVLRYTAMGGDFIVLWHQSATPVTLALTYVRAPAPMLLDTDIPEAPEEYHPRLVDYGIYRMRQVEGGQEFQKALKYFASFMAGAQHYAEYVRGRNRGNQYDTVPFEMEQFDQSQLLKLRKDLMPAAKVPEV